MRDLMDYLARDPLPGDATWWEHTHAQEAGMDDATRVKTVACGLYVEGPSVFIPPGITMRGPIRKGDFTFHPEFSLAAGETIVGPAVITGHGSVSSITPEMAARREARIATAFIGGQAEYDEWRRTSTALCVSLLAAEASHG